MKLIESLKAWRGIRWVQRMVSPRPSPEYAESRRRAALHYADYILNHYSRDSHPDKLSLAKDLERHGWTERKRANDENDGTTLRAEFERLKAPTPEQS